MTDSAFPGQTTSDELKAMLRSMADAQAKHGDRIVEILVRQKAQDEKLISQGTLLTGLNQRLVAVEAKAERTARLQEELEGDVLREVSVQARKIDALAAETTRQSKTLAEQNENMAEQDAKLAELIDDKKQVLMLLKSLKWICIAGPVVAGVVLWAMQHIKL